MSSKRKRAPPVKVDEEAKKRLNWNMHEDRRNEVDSEVSDQSSLDVIANCLPLSNVEPSPSCSKSFLSDMYVVEERDESDIVLSEDGLINSNCITNEETPGPSTSCASPVKPSNVREMDNSAHCFINDSVVLPLITFSDFHESWYSLIGEFNLRAQSAVLLEDRLHWTLQRNGGRLCLCASGVEADGDFSGDSAQSSEQICLVQGSLARLELEELDWLQKRRIIQLCVETEEEYVKVCTKIWSTRNIYDGR